MTSPAPLGDIPLRHLLPGQRCVVSTHDLRTGRTEQVWSSTELLLEAPNWIGADALVLNGNGVLWRLDRSDGSLTEIVIDGVPALNNDHVPTADGTTMYVSAYDFHLYRAPIDGGTATRVTDPDPDRPLLCFLHGVHPGGEELAFVGVEPGADGPWGPANIFTIAATGGAVRQLTFGTAPADGCEYSPEGDLIYFNTEAFSASPGHAQCARMERDGSGLVQLTFDDRVNWFPHVAPDGSTFVYLSYEPGTTGHPENRTVELRLVQDGGWDHPTTVATLFGGQGTINVNSWSPDGSAFAFVSYPTGRTRRGPTPWTSSV